MKPFYVLVHISYVNTVAEPPLFAAVFYSLLVIAYGILSRWQCRNYMRVAYSYCNELLLVLVWLSMM